MQAGDFFDQVFFKLDVEAIAGRGDDEVCSVAGEGQGQTGEECRNLFASKGDAKYFGNTRRTQAYRVARREFCFGCTEGACLATADVEDEL